MKAIGTKVQFGNGAKGIIAGYATYKFRDEDPGDEETRYVVELIEGTAGWMTPQGNRDPALFISAVLVHPDSIKEWKPTP